MTNYQGIIVSMMVYLSIIAALFYVLLFSILPSSRIARSEIDQKLCGLQTTHHAHIATPRENVYGNSANWKYLRETIMEIQGDKCLCCGKKETIMHVDHIKPKSIYPHLEYMIDNLQVLCPKCNREKSYLKETDYRKSDHLIALVRKVKGNKLLQRKYVYDMDILENLATKRFQAEMKNREYPRILPIS